MHDVRESAGRYRSLMADGTEPQWWRPPVPLWLKREPPAELCHGGTQYPASPNLARPRSKAWPQTLPAGARHAIALWSIATSGNTLGQFPPEVNPPNVRRWPIIAPLQAGVVPVGLAGGKRFWRLRGVAVQYRSLSGAGPRQTEAVFRSLIGNRSGSWS